MRAMTPLSAVQGLAGKRVMLIGAGHRYARTVQEHIKGAGAAEVLLVATNEDAYERMRDSQPEGRLLFAALHEPSKLSRVLEEHRPQMIFVCGHPWDYETILRKAIQGLTEGDIERMYLVPAHRRPQVTETIEGMCGLQDFLEIIDIDTREQRQPDDETQYAEHICNSDSGNPFRRVLDRRASLPVGIEDFYRGKSVVVTGGAGSVGREVVARLKTYGASHVTVIDVDAEGIDDLSTVYDSAWLSVVAESPVDLTSPHSCDYLGAIFARQTVDLVFHMSAIKLHPFAQSYPDVAFWANTVNTRHVVDTVIKQRIPRFLFTSSDKATWLRPVNVLGQTRRLAEYYIQAAAAENDWGNFVITRFAHVLGSAGSLVTRRFIRQIAQGLPITLTDYEAACPFMNMGEAVDLILSAMMLGQTGEIITQARLGRAVKIHDVARYLTRRITGGEDYPIIITGKAGPLNVREGEPDRKGPDSGEYGLKSQFDLLERPFVCRKGDFSVSTYRPPIRLSDIAGVIRGLEEKICAASDSSDVKSLLAGAIDCFAQLQSPASLG